MVNSGVSHFHPLPNCQKANQICCFTETKDQFPYLTVITNPQAWIHSDTTAYGDVSVAFNDAGYTNYKNFHQTVVNKWRAHTGTVCDVDSRW